MTIHTYRAAAALLVLVAALVSVAPASAHNTRFRWTAVKAENELMRQGMYWPLIGSHDTVSDASCHGVGSSVYSPKLHDRTYRHFVCDVVGIRGGSPQADPRNGLPEELTVSLHALGLHRFVQYVLVDG